MVRGLIRRQVALLIAVMLAIPFMDTLTVQAAALTNYSDTMSRQQISANSDHDIRFDLVASVDNGANIVVDLDDSFDSTGVVVGDIDMSINGVDQDLATTWGVVVNNVTDVITFTNNSGSSIGSNGQQVVIKIGTNAAGGTNQINNPGTALNYNIVVTAGSDNATIVVAIVNNDQILITGSVNQTLSFSLIDAAGSDFSIGFGELTTANSRYATGDGAGSDAEEAAHTLTAATNTANGYTISVRGTTLTGPSAVTIDAIGGTATAPANNTEQFGMKVSASGGIGAVSAPYNTANYAYAADATTVDEIASAASASDTTTYSLYYVANIDGITDPGAYSTTLTYIATANF